jgi:hypothetical protein
MYEYRLYYPGKLCGIEISKIIESDMKGQTLMRHPVMNSILVIFS